MNKLIAVDDRSAGHAAHVTLTRGLRGWFAVLVRWCPEHDGFWEPWSTGVGSYTTAIEAVPEAKAWAEAEGCAYHPPTEVTS